MFSTFSKTVTRRLASRLEANPGSGCVSAKPETLNTCLDETPLAMSLRRAALARSADIPT